jgi:hypothetical protein
MIIAKSKRTITILPATRRMIDIWLLPILLCALVSLLMPAYAADSKESNQTGSIDTLLTDIQRTSKNISALKKRLSGAEGILKTAIDSRLIRSLMILLEQNL